jgi:taurine transport system permease protein
VLDWLSQERAFIASVIIVILLITLLWSILVGLRQATYRAKDQVFGDPERTLGGWYWTLSGVSAILLLWFYFSWGVGRAFFPEAGNEMCQVAKVETAIAPIKAALPIDSRYFKSTELIVRNTEQLDVLESNFPEGVFNETEKQELLNIIVSSRKIIGIFSDQDNQSLESKLAIRDISQDLDELTDKLSKDYTKFNPSSEGLLQPNWGTTRIELPLLPITPKGVLFDDISKHAEVLSQKFLKLRNNSAAANSIIEATKQQIKRLKLSNEAADRSDEVLKERKHYIKAVERIFRRLDDGTIFPPQALDELNDSIKDFLRAIEGAKGNLRLVQAFFIPGAGVVKSKTQCTEQGSGRWLPKPTDVVAKFLLLANPNLEKRRGI